MKKYIISLILGGFLSLSSCHDLDMSPLSKGSTENWYSSEKEIELALNSLYNMAFWSHYSTFIDGSDDYFSRESMTSLENGTLNGQSGFVTSVWNTQYRVIARANSIILGYQRAIDNGASESKIMEMVAEAHFHRACAYAKLVPLFGDVPLVNDYVDIDEAFTMGRTNKEDVKKQIYEDFDIASKLPEKSKARRATKGAALAFKARFALYMQDWDIAAKASEDVMALNIYKLHGSYSDLFGAKSRTSDERIFAIPRSVLYDVVIDAGLVKSHLPRNAGGFGELGPSWELLASYTCTDGLAIDKSPLFDPHEPFKNRDPRCKMTIVPFGEEFLGYEYNPHPEARTVMNYSTGKMVANNDTRANAQFASFNGLLWKKGIDQTWRENGFKAEPDLIVCRYAEVLLTYAEAKIELNEIDNSVLEAMNTVRARAYGVEKLATDKYPTITTTDQSELRIILRTERRVELAKENLRNIDLMRWKYSEIVMKRKGYGMLYPIDKLMTEVVNKGEWFWAFPPEIDKDGLPDFSKLEQAGKIQPYTQRAWSNRQYLWPIPSNEVLINSNMKQNPDY